MKSSISKRRQEKQLDANRLITRPNQVPLYNAKGKVVGALAIAIDIISQKFSEKPARNTHPFIEDIVYDLPGLIYWKNMQSQYIGFNKNVVTLSGLSREELMGKTDVELNWGKKEAEEFIKDDKEVMETGAIKVTEHQIPIKRSDGNFMVVRTEKSRLCDKEGVVVGVLGVAVDIPLVIEF